MKLPKIGSIWLLCLLAFVSCGRDDMDVIVDDGRDAVEEEGDFIGEEEATQPVGTFELDREGAVDLDEEDEEEEDAVRPETEEAL